MPEFLLLDGQVFWVRVNLADQSNREGWPAERFLGALLEQEVNERETRRLARARVDSQLPPDKSLANFDFDAVPAVSKAHVTALAEADEWIAQGHNLLAFGPPSVGKTHLVAGIGHALIDHGYKVAKIHRSLRQVAQFDSHRKKAHIRKHQVFASHDVDSQY